MRTIDRLRAPLLVTWQLTRDCDLCCLHCCTDSAPGKALPGELDAAEALALAGRLVDGDVPYVMLCGGEPLVVPHFLAVAEALGAAGVQLKIETNGQRFTREVADRLARLPIRSIQISLDGDTEEVYGRQRPGGSLAKAHDACRAARAADLPLEVTFAPTRITIDHAEAVIARARELGAFRFNTGRLMRVGTAARLWDRVEPTAAQYRTFRETLDREARIAGEMELCYSPFALSDALRDSLDDPPATLLVLPDGRVKVSAVLPHICASLRDQPLVEAWQAYRDAWRDPAILAAARHAVEDESLHANANRWKSLSVVSA
jgi:MoaA/NifB/PqqE/SkfB family radical SAM enzyme